MLSINTIARVIVNVVRPAAQPTSWDTGLLLVKDASFADAKRLRTYANSTEAAGRTTLTITRAMVLMESMDLSTSQKK